MFDIASWLYNQQKPNNQMPGNQMPSLIPSPLENLMKPGMNLGVANPGSAPAYAQSASPQAPGAPPAFPQGGMNPQDSLRKMLIMQALMGEEPRQAIMSGQAGGEGLRGSGGFQNDPNAGLLNSFPPQMAQRKRFIGGGY